MKDMREYRLYNDGINWFMERYDNNEMTFGVMGKSESDCIIQMFKLPNVIDPVGLLAHNKISGQNGKVINYSDNEFTVKLCGCDGFFTDNVTNWMLTSL